MLKKTITYDRHGFILNGKRTFLLNGTIPYYRLHSADWGIHLDLLKASGYNGVDVYVPWNYHEPMRGAFDFTTGNRDLGAFLDAIHERGLRAYLRPGPYICNEWDSGGLPQWLQRVPGLRIRENEKQFLECAANYLQKICDIARERQYTRNGPVILFAVENEYDLYPTQTDRHAYIAHLRDTVRNAGIEVPLTACVGGGAAIRSATGLADDVIPTPNYYIHNMVEQKVEDMRRHLLAQKFASGAPMSDLPVFVTEMGRYERDQLRVLAGGVKGLGPFNMSGGSHCGFWNGLTNWGGITPISSVIDFEGITGFDGTVFNNFFATRRVTGFIRAFEQELLLCETAHSRIADAPQVDNPLLGSTHYNSNDRRVYSLLNNDHGFVFLYNETKDPQSVRVIPYQQPAFPRLAPLVLPPNIPQTLHFGIAPGRLAPQQFFRVLPFNIPLERWGLPGTLKYTTGQVFFFEALGNGANLALYGEEGETFELLLSAPWKINEKPAHEFPRTMASVETTPDGTLLQFKATPEISVISLVCGDKALCVTWMNRAAAETWNLKKSPNLLRRRAVAKPIHDGWTCASIQTPPAIDQRIKHFPLPGFYPLESYNLTPPLDRGSAWYHCSVATPDLPPNAPLVLERALDLISVYWDGEFIGTQWGTGDPLTFFLPTSKAGKHSLEIRTEIWGHSNYHDATHYATRLDSKRGLVEGITLNHAPLEGTWRLQFENAPPASEKPAPVQHFDVLAGEAAVFTRALDRDYPLGAVLTLKGEHLHGEVWLDDWMAGRFLLNLLTPREKGGKIFLTGGPGNQFFLPGALAHKGALLHLITRADNPAGSITRATLSAIEAMPTQE